MEKFEEITCNDSFRKYMFPSNKCKYSWFTAEKVYVLNQECDGVWEIGQQIGEKSSFGKASIACCGKSCKYIMKEVIFNQDFTKQMFIDEVVIQEKIYKASGLAPKVYDVILGKDRGVVVMEAMQYTLKRYAHEQIKNLKYNTPEWNNVLASITQKGIHALEQLHTAGFYHGDAHADNFMTKDNGTSWMMIDFGTSAKLQQDKEESVFRVQNDFRQLYTDLVMTFDYDSPALKEKKQ